MTIDIWLGIALVISVAVNILMVWFSKEQSQKLSYVSQNLGDLVELTDNYRQHLKKVYSLEMFYGDEVLKGLMEHTNAMVFLLEQEYGEIASITDPLEVVFEKEEDSEEEKEEEREQDVFYGGTRERNT